MGHRKAGGGRAERQQVSAAPRRRDGEEDLGLEGKVHSKPWVCGEHYQLMGGEAGSVKPAV